MRKQKRLIIKSKQLFGLMNFNMAYKTEDLFNIATEKIKKHRLIFIEDIIAYLPCRKSTFYEHFPNDSDYYKRMFELLEINRTELKVSLRYKWYNSNAPALQMALMKLICNQDELKRLAMVYSENKNENTEAPKEITYRIVND